MIGYERGLIERQTQLRARAAAQRERLEHDIRPLLPYITLTQRGWSMGRALTRNAGWIAVGVAALAVYRPRMTLRTAGRLWGLWRAARLMRRFLVL